MWHKSALSAASAQKYAQDLERNRNRLRDSVSRFQQRIFSDEAMHWQMTQSFRNEMFHDVITYLDEFAAQATSEVGQVDSVDSVVRDYLLVAGAALEVGQIDAAQLAADHALLQIRQSEKTNETSSDSLFLHFEAARIACLSRMDDHRLLYLIPRNLEVVHDNMPMLAPRELELRMLKTHELLQECQENLDRFALMGTPEHRWELAQATAEYLRMRVQDSKSSTEIESLKKLFDRLRTSKANTHEGRVSQERLTQVIGSYLATTLPTELAIEIVEDNIEIAEHFRDQVRGDSALLAESDFGQARNFAQHAVLLKSNGDVQAAVESGRLAQKSFLLGNRQRPQNRYWTSQSLLLELQLSDWLQEIGDDQAALVSLETTIRSCLSLSKSDRDDRPLRRTIIKLFVKLADLSAKLENYPIAIQEYFIAVQDCRMIVDDPTDRAWVLKIRPWLVSSILNLLERSPDPDFHKKFIKLESDFMTQIQKYEDVDTTGIQSVEDKTSLPERPDELANITADILLGNW